MKMNKVVNSKNKKNDSSIVSRQLTSYQGPIPPASELEKFDKIEKGIASRIISMAEKDGEHTRKIREKMVDNDASMTEMGAKIISKGQTFGFIIMLFAMILSAYLFVKGKQITGTIFGGSAIVIVVLNFLRPFKNKK